MLDKITPVLLTYNEEANLDRTLRALDWARDIVIVDSFSIDRTLEIAARHPRVKLFQRAFESHSKQWNFAIRETGIVTDWILALDADYLIRPAFVEELRELEPDECIAGYSAAFRYLVAGVPLRGTLYPPMIVLFRRDHGHYVQDGHTQTLKVDGRVGRLTTKVDHDDRKSLSQWIMSQDQYAHLEAAKIGLTTQSELNWPDKVRRFPVLAPFLVFAYCYFGKGVFLDGKFGLYYALQRLLAETLLALRLIEAKLDKN